MSIDNCTSKVNIFCSEERKIHFIVCAILQVLSKCCEDCVDPVRSLSEVCRTVSTELYATYGWTRINTSPRFLQNKYEPQGNIQHKDDVLPSSQCEMICQILFSMLNCRFFQYNILPPLRMHMVMGNRTTTSDMFSAGPTSCL